MTTSNILQIALALVICTSVTIAQSLDEQALERSIKQSLSEAAKVFNLDECDALILRSVTTVEWSEDGRFKTEFERIVWIASKAAIGRYADNRIPYDDSKQKLTCNTLSTLRDGEWIHSGETAKVETLPFGVANCPDYSDMREIMLLHDGIELPCVLVLNYSIEDKALFRRGAEDLWLPQTDDPVIESVFHLTTPTKKKPAFFASEEVPKPIVTTDSSSGLDTYTFTMSNLSAMPMPHTVDPAAYLPHVTWSTWRNWDEFSKDLSRPFKAALKLDDTLIDSLGVVIKGSRTLTEKADFIADFVDRSTRFVSYDMPSRMFNPRLPDEVFNSAYCDRLDRVVLAGALFQEAGFVVFPVFRGRGYGDVNEGIPSVSRMDGIGLWVSGEDLLEAYYDPRSSRLQNGFAPIFGRTVWIPGDRENEPRLTLGGEGMESRIDLNLELSLDTDKEEWQGRGYYVASNGFNAFDQMSGLDSESRDYLESVLTGVIEDAEISDYNPVTFHRFNMTLGFNFTVPLGDKDGYDRYTMVIGDPGGGWFDRLPDDIELCSEKRKSPVRLFGVMEQNIEFKFNTDGWEVIYIPDNRTITNDIGEFRLEIERSDDEVAVKRTLRIDHCNIPSENWSSFRTLGLADRHERNRTVIFSKQVSK